MKTIKAILILNLFFAGLISNAQISVVYDNDGFVNVREKPSVKSKITGKIIEGQAFCISPFDDENGDKEWAKVWYPINPDPKNKDFIRYKDIKEEGFVHKSRILEVEKLEGFSFRTDNPKKISLKTDHLQINIEIQSFEKANHQVARKKDGGFSIDRNPDYWGLQGEIPKNEVKNIKIATGNNSYVFPKNAFMGIYDLNLEFTKLYIGKKDELYLKMSGGDGSDSYEIIWCLKNHKIFSMTVMQIIP